MWNWKQFSWILVFIEFLSFMNFNSWIKPPSETLKTIDLSIKDLKLWRNFLLMNDFIAWCTGHLEITVHWITQILQCWWISLCNVKQSHVLILQKSLWCIGKLFCLQWIQDYQNSNFPLRTQNLSLATFIVSCFQPHCTWE